MEKHMAADLPMRSVLVGLLAGSLAGCATVSMAPGETTVETGISKKQTALRQASDAYCSDAEDKGWVGEQGGLAGLASILINGQRKDRQPSVLYGEHIGAGSGDTGDLALRIADDAASANSGLQTVIAEAEAVKASGKAIRRADVTSFERALVRAQRARRGFSAATETVRGRGGDVDAARMAIDEFALEIDRARQLADDLLDLYADTGGPGA